MKEDIAKAWIADLRTNPPRATGVLFDGKGHCCLGRLCVVLGIKPELRCGGFFFGDRSGLLPDEAREKAGIKYSRGAHDIVVGGMHFDSLADANDLGRTFSEIAHAVERHWPDM